MYLRLIFTSFFVAKSECSDLEEEWKTVTDWFIQFGDVTPSMELGIGPVGRGLFARETLPTYSVLLQVPIQNVISVEVALKSGLYTFYSR